MEVGADVAGTLVEEESGRDVSTKVVDGLTADADGVCKVNCGTKKLNHSRCWG